ncbi:MAG TPA: glycosyltransferase family 4 protein [Opitutaceae bacterium]|nr:glycosyltransferase family 4 protein [Opitutaceae bacterium]
MKVEVSTDFPDARILIVVENMSVPRDRRVWQEAQALRRAGYEVLVICPRGTNGDSEPFEERDGVEIHRFSPRPAGSALGYAIEYAWATWHIARSAWRLSRPRGFAVVQVCNPPDVILPILRVLLPRKTRFVFDHHDAVPELYMSRFKRGHDLIYRLLMLLERTTLRLADVVIATNESYRDLALGRGRRAPHNVFIVRNGPDSSWLQRAQPNPELKGGKAHLLAYAGVMGPQDGVDGALRALASLREIRSDWRAVFAGEGDAAPSMRSLTTNLGLEDFVTFPGWLGNKELAELIATADVCLAPDPSNALNDISTMVKVAEYMAAGRAVVSFDLPETRITAEDTILYASSEAEFAERIAYLLDNPDRRSSLGRAARARIKEGLTWEQSERELLAAYAQATGRAI